MWFGYAVCHICILPKYLFQMWILWVFYSRLASWVLLCWMMICWKSLHHQLWSDIWPTQTILSFCYWLVGFDNNTHKMLNRKWQPQQKMLIAPLRIDLSVILLDATFSIEMERVSMINIMILNTAFIIILLSVFMQNLVMLSVNTIDIESLKNKWLKVCYVPSSSTCLPRFIFIFIFCCSH